MSVKLISPYTPLLYSKTGVCRGIPFFLLFALKHIDFGYTLEPPRCSGSNEYPQSLFWNKNKKNRYTLYTPIFLYKSGIRGYTLHGHVNLMLRFCSFVIDL